MSAFVAPARGSRSTGTPGVLRAVVLEHAQGGVVQVVELTVSGRQDEQRREDPAQGQRQGQQPEQGDHGRTSLRGRPQTQSTQPLDRGIHRAATRGSTRPVSARATATAL